MQKQPYAIYVCGDNVISPLGNNSLENFERLASGSTGIKLHSDEAIADAPFYASLIDHADKDTLLSGQRLTRFESLLIRSITDALKQTNIDIASEKTGLIISTTKGNIALIESDRQYSNKESVSLPLSARKIAAALNHSNPPLVVSNACISGSLALLTGMRLIKCGQYESVVVAGCDLITKFILSGFQSFQAVSALPCRPFDQSRNGVTLGEAAATIVLSSNNPGHRIPISLKGGAVTNDANHISGPSRTGEELKMAIANALSAATLQTSDIDFISAHGTATVYNDEMEAKAIALAGLASIPTNSLKGNYGHTLGASGLLESVLSIQALRHEVMLPTSGYSMPGTSQPINICANLQPLKARNFLKTASGFGGCNAALVFGM